VTSEEKITRGVTSEEVFSCKSEARWKRCGRT
jgi:hypothetical protein